MRGWLTAVVCLLGASTSACAPLYYYRIPGSPTESPDMSELTKRLESTLELHGFKRLALEPGELAPLSDDTGFHQCDDARNLEVFAFRDYGVATVHLYACAQDARIVVIASFLMSDEPSRTRDIISAEFSQEIQNGTVVLENRCRLVLR